MDKSEDKTQVIAELERRASKRATERSRAARWDLNIAVFLFLVLIAVIILLFQKVDVVIVGSVAIVGLALVWLVGWRRGNSLYREFYEEELAELKDNLKAALNAEETIEEKVQKAFLKRL